MTLRHEPQVHFWRYIGFSGQAAFNIMYEGLRDEYWIDSDYLLTDTDGHFTDWYFCKPVILYEYFSFTYDFPVISQAVCVSCFTCICSF